MNRALLPVVALLCCTVPSVRAAELAIELSSAQSQGTDVPVKIGVPGLLAEVRLRNTSRDVAGVRTFKPGETLLRTSDGLARPATWRRLDAPAGSAGAIAPGAELVLQLTADLPEPGVYETWIDTAVKGDGGAADVPDRRVHVVVAREVAAVPDNLLLEPKPMREVRWPWVSGKRVLLVQMRNTTAKPVEFMPPSVLAFDLKTGDRLNAVSAARLPGLDASACALPLAPGAHCALKLTIRGGLPPGQYAIDMGVAGRGGGWSPTTALVSVRLPLLFAFLATTLGVGCGWYVQFWRASGRRALNGIIGVKALRGRVGSILSGAPGIDLAPIAQPILDGLETSEAHARSGADVTADLDAMTTRVARLSIVSSVERAFKSLPPVAQSMLSAPHARFMQQAIATPAAPDRVEFDTISKALSMNVNDWPSLDAARAAATALLGTMERLLSLPAGDAARAPAAAAHDALQTALSAATAGLAAEDAGTKVSDQAETLHAAQAQGAAAIATGIQAYADELRPRLEAVVARTNVTAHQLARAQAALADLDRLGKAGDANARTTRLVQLWPASVATAPDVESVGRDMLESVPFSAASAPGSLPAPDVPVAIAFDLTPARSQASLQRQLWRNEIATNLIILAGMGLAGVVLAASNDTWGSATDFITAILAGLGSRVVLGELGAAAQPAPAAH